MPMMDQPQAFVDVALPFLDSLRKALQKAFKRLVQ
jgi:hypothetical protein